MDTFYSRNVWKKRSLIGYDHQTIKQVVQQLQDEHTNEMARLTAKLEERKKRLQENLDVFETLKMEFHEHKPKENEWTLSLYEKLVETTHHIQLLQEEHERKLALLDEQIEIKRKEKEQIVIQLKETLQQLHNTFTNLGRVNDDV